MLIAIEGTDGVGKATQAKMLVDRFTSQREHAVLFSFPRYDTPLGAAIKRHLVGNTRFDGPKLDDMMFFQAAMTVDKYDALPDIQRALARGHHVVCDRWTSSAITFGSVDGLDHGWRVRMQRALPIADLNVLLTISEAEALKRRPSLRDRYEQDREHQAKVRVAYRKLWQAPPSGRQRWVTLNGHGSPQDVHEQIWSEVRP